MSVCGAHKHLISGDCLRQAISKSITAVEASSFPSVFKEGWLRLNKKVPFLSGADGVVSKRARSLLIHIRVSAPILFEITNHPVCAAKKRDLFISSADNHILTRREIGPSRKQSHSPPPR